MTKPHKNAEFIKAYADGKDIQWLSASGTWNDFDADDAHLLFYNSDAFLWRIKPEQLWYRVALYKDGIGNTTCVVNSEVDEHIWQQDIYFVRWLTERVPYNI